jgi:hypothetical protein
LPESSCVDELRRLAKGHREKRQAAVRHRQAEEGPLGRCRQAVTDLRRAISDMRSAPGRGATSHQSVDMAPHFAEVSARLKNVFEALDEAHLFGTFSDIDEEKTWSAYNPVPSEGDQESDMLSRGLALSLISEGCNNSGNAEMLRLLEVCWNESPSKIVWYWLLVLLRGWVGDLWVEWKGEATPCNGPGKKRDSAFAVGSGLWNVLNVVETFYHLSLDPGYLNLSSEGREAYAWKFYEAIYPDLVTLAKADTSQWMGLDAWDVVWDFIELIRSHMTVPTPWVNVWGRICNAIKKEVTVPDWDRCRQEIRKNMARLQASAKGLAPNSPAAKQPASTEGAGRGIQAGAEEGSRKSQELNEDHTLPPGEMTGQTESSASCDNHDRPKSPGLAATEPPEGIEQSQLSERGQEILKALLELGAEGRRRKVTRDKAAGKADPKGSASSYYKDIATLGKDGLIVVARGAGGGIWLTPKGKSTAKALSSGTDPKKV